MALFTLSKRIVSPAYRRWVRAPIELDKFVMADVEAEQPGSQELLPDEEEQ